MDLAVGGHRLVDGAEELAELDGAVPAMAMASTSPVATLRAAKSDVVPWRL